MSTNRDLRTFFTPEHHLNENGTALYVEALLLNREPELPNEITSHLEQCDDCKEQVLGLHDLMSQQSIDRSSPHPFLDRRPVFLRFPAYLKAAAVLLAVLAVGATYHLFTLNGGKRAETPIQSSFPVTTTADTSVKLREDTEKMFAEYFVPSPNLDDLVRSDFRSEMIEVLKPKIDAIVASPIIFQWKQYHRPVILKILNNKDFVVQTSRVRNNRFVSTKSFTPGLYYWKLEDDGDLLFVGKFFVK